MLGSFGTYCMSIFLVSLGVLNYYNLYARRSFEETFGDRKMNWVWWDKVMIVKKKVGWGWIALFP